jgi:hypothetical protein
MFIRMNWYLTFLKTAVHWAVMSLPLKLIHPQTCKELDINNMKIMNPKN